MDIFIRDVVLSKILTLLNFKLFLIFLFLICIAITGKLFEVHLACTILNVKSYVRETLVLLCTTKSYCFHSGIA